jgi:hypothetical protein
MSLALREYTWFLSFYTEELVYFIIGNNKNNYTVIAQFITRMSVRPGRLPRPKSMYLLFRSDASWHLQDHVAFKLLPQNFSNLLKSFLICATTMSPHDVVLALAFNHDTDWLPVTLQNLAWNVTDTISHRLIFMAPYS